MFWPSEVAINVVGYLGNSHIGIILMGNKFVKEKFLIWGVLLVSVTSIG